MGEVYRVHDRDLDEVVALKLLRADYAKGRSHRRRLRAEVRLARRVSHPNVCRVHDLGQHDGGLFVTMELIRGASLRELLRPSHHRGLASTPLAHKVDVVNQICAGLSAAHAAGVLHRDVKPDNVILERDRAVLTDFGIASLHSDEGDRKRRVGTPGYVAPEVLLGRAADHRVDVYGVGVLTYELFARQRPFQVVTLQEALDLARRRAVPPPLPSEAVDEGVHRAVDRVLQRALAFEPAQRWPDIDAFARALAQAIRGMQEEGWGEGGFTRTPTSPRLTGSFPLTLPSSPGFTDTLRTPDAGLVTPSNALRRGPGQVTRLHVATALFMTDGSPYESGGEGLSLSLAGPFDSIPTPGPTPGSFGEEALIAPFTGGARETFTSAHTLDDIERIVVDFGGTPLEITPGMVSAVFGVPSALGDDAVRAAEAAFALLEVASADIGVGLATSRVLYRLDGRGRPSVSGDAIAAARDLGTSASPGEVWASPATARHLVRGFEAREVLEATFEGHPARRLEPMAVQTAGPRTPLLGRDRELEQLTYQLRAAWEERVPRFATVLGPAGVGKTRLRREIVESLEQRRDVDWLFAEARPLDEAAPLALLQSAHPDWASAAAGQDSPRAALAAARRWIELRAATRPVGLILEDIHWADEASLELVRLLARELDQVPVAVLALARPELLDRAPWWSRELCGTPHRSPVEALPERLLLELRPVDVRSAAQLARHHAPDISETELRRIVHLSEGNPFFVEELARDLHERLANSGDDFSSVGAASTSEATKRNRDRAVAAGGTPPPTMPTTVEAVVQARLDRLPHLERELAEAASVIGQEFWREAAREALEARLSPIVDATGSSGDGATSGATVGDRQLDDALAGLERRDIVFALPPSGVDDERYAFKHALVRDVAYAQLQPRDRRRIHGVIGDWLERWGDDLAKGQRGVTAVVAQHLDAAGEKIRARTSYVKAAREAAELFAPSEASRLARRALSLTEGRPESSLLELLADAIEVCESAPVAEVAYRRALDGLEAPADQSDGLRAARLCQKVGGCRMRQGDYTGAIEWYERGLSTLDETGRGLALPGDEALTTVSGLFGSLGWVLGYLMGNNERGLAYAERAVRLLEGTPHQRELARGLSRLGANYMRAGRWQDQLACNRRNLEIGESLRDIELQCTAHINLGVVYQSLGKVDTSIQHTRRAIALGKRLGAVATVALARSNLGGLLLEKGSLKRARRELEEAVRVGERVGSHTFLSESYGYAARLLATEGDLTRGLEHANRALALAESAESDIDRGIAQRIRGAILARQGELDGATIALDASLGYLAETEPFEYARTQAAYVRVLQSVCPDRADEAASLREAAKAAFERLGGARELELLDNLECIR